MSNFGFESKETQSKTINYTKDDLDRKIHYLIYQYAQNRNLNTILNEIDQFRPSESEQYCELVQGLINVILERQKDIRVGFGHVFYKAIKQNILKFEYFLEGLKRIFENLDKLWILVPKISTFLAEILTPFFNKHNSLQISRNFYLIENNLCTDLIYLILSKTSNLMSHEIIENIFRNSMEYNQEIHKNFIEKNNLEWIVSIMDLDKHENKTVEYYEKRLAHLLFSEEDKKAKNEALIENIKSNFSELDLRRKEFIRALVICVCKSCLVERKIDIDLFKTRAFILKVFLNHNEDLELETLYAVQALDHRTKHYPGTSF